MNTELWINIATIASPIIGVLAIIVALIISTRSSRQSKDALKDLVAHQADINWGHLQHYFIMNEFEKTDKIANLLAFLRKNNKIRLANNRQWTTS